MKGLFPLVSCVFFQLFSVGTISAAARLTDYINAARGTNNDAGGYSHGNTVPATCLPHGFNIWTPMTDATSSGWIYQWGKTQINAFACSHIPSPWIGDHAQMQFMPQIGTLKTSAAGRLTGFSHANEIAKGYFYDVTLNNGIRVEIAPTMHAAAIRFTFPAGSAHLVFSSLGGLSGSITVDKTAKTVSGHIDHRSPRMYFFATLDAGIDGVGYPTDAGIAANIDFTTSSNQTVTMRMATSYISLAQASANLTQEIGSQSFDQVKEAAAAAWDSVLTKITLTGATEEQNIIFYSNLYRSFVYPSSFWENVNGTAQYFSPFDNKVHNGKLYVNNGFWDTFKTAWPLYVLLEPSIAGDMLNGLVDAFKQAGAIPRWIAPGFFNAMVSTHYNVLFADAYGKGLRNFDFTSAYQSSLKDATTYSSSSDRGRKANDRAIFLGYVPSDVQEAAAWSLENGMCDAAIARMAEALGKADDAAYFKNRSLWYTNLWSPSVGKFFRGKNSNGSWRTSDATFYPNEWGYEFCEGNAWHYRFAPAYDGQGLANLFGGRSSLAAALDEAFSADRSFRVGSYGRTIHEMSESYDANTGQYNHTNQPDHYMMYLYNYAGTPSKTAYHVRDVLTRLYSTGVGTGNGFLGDEDNGSIASWYVFSAMGIFPAAGAVPEYLIGSPLFSSATIHLENGKTFTITAANNTSANLYVQSALLNGSTISKSYITHPDITAGGTLALTMGALSSSWGTGAGYLPTSMTSDSTAPTPFADIAESGTISSSGESSSTGEGADKAFDNNSQTKWLCQSSTAWIQYQVPSAKRITMYTLTSGNDFPERDPKNWSLKGSNDGNTWTTLDTRTNQTFSWRYQTRNFSVTTMTAYKFYRVEITLNNGAPATQLTEVEFIEGSTVQTAAFTPVSSNHKTGDIALAGRRIVLSKAGDYAMTLYNLAGRVIRKTSLCGSGAFLISKDVVSGGLVVVEVHGKEERLRKAVLMQ